MSPLTEILKGEKPTALRRIEGALASLEERGDAPDVTLTALIWRRRVSGNYGILATFIYSDCTKRIAVIPEHLDRIGARDAATAVRWLRKGVPFGNEQIAAGVVNWLEMDKTLKSRARIYDRDLGDIAPLIWQYMRQSAAEFPDMDIPDGRRGFFSRLFH